MTAASPRTTEVLLRATQEARNRFWNKIDPQPNGCWNRIGCTDGNGYSRVQLERRSFSGHRAAYTWTKGPIPDGLFLDHLCRNRRCVNPDHLEPVSHDENMARGMRPNQTHCKWGHEYTPANTGWLKRPNGKVSRDCHICRLRYKKQQRERKRAAT